MARFDAEERGAQYPENRNERIGTRHALIAQASLRTAERPRQVTNVVQTPKHKPGKLRRKLLIEVVMQGQ
jgi:hypothetical protein